MGKGLSTDEVALRLAALPGWSVADTPAAQELTRTFRFASFADAIAFMQSAAPRIDALNHHPRWENVYDRLTVWLSTHDAGNVVTDLDFTLAAVLDALAAERATTST